MSNPTPTKTTEPSPVTDWLDELIRNKEEEGQTSQPPKPLTPPPPVHGRHLGRGCLNDDFQEED